MKSVSDVFLTKRENRFSKCHKEFLKALNEANERKNEPTVIDEKGDAIEQGLNDLLGLGPPIGLH